MSSRYRRLLFGRLLFLLVFIYLFALAISKKVHWTFCAFYFAVYCWLFWLSFFHFHSSWPTNL